ncbi:MAG TPA: chemotaxis protein CheW [Gemmatimonadaceae bacterium]|nr:chemotaxis protein CheW [Gemmatimonadaceae bacterium]
MTATPATLSSRDAVQGGKFLTFLLAGEEYGVEILKVHEIMGMLPVTRVPRTPEYVRGVINLRGKVIPIIDLRRKFGMAAGTDETCIIVVQVRGLSIGIAVDQVNEVLNIATGDIEPPPSFGTEVDTAFLLGMAKAEGRVRLLLDIERVLTTSEIDQLEATQHAA